MDELRIDKDVEMPVITRNANKYPFREMEVGDSFFFETEKPSSGMHENAKRTHGIKIATRKVEEDGKKGYRVWRLS